MLDKKIARRYAQALLEIGKESNQIDQFKKELSAFSDLLKKFPQLHSPLLSPLYSNEDLKKIIVKISPRIPLSPTVEHFLCLLVDKRRIQYFFDILAIYEELTHQFFGYIKAKVVTAIPLNPEYFEGIRHSLEKILQKKVILDTVVDPQIIGGVVTEVGGKVFDGSIKNQLQKMGETLI